MNIQINNRIAVDVTLTPKKKKGNVDLYDMYIYFSVYEMGIKQRTCTLSTGIDILVTEYINGKIIGRSIQAKQKETRLNEYLSTAVMLIQDLKAKKIKTCSELKFEIDQNARQRVTGKVSRGFKQDAISKLESLTYGRILNKYLSIKQLSKDRERNFKRTEKLINEYFNNDMPSIDQITKEDLKAFKEWFGKVHPMSQNAQTTYLGQIAAIFNYAVNENIIQINPLPKGFTGSFVDGKREVLSEKQILAVMNIEDTKLSHGMQVAKYCFLLQTLSGMGYGDLQALRHDNLKCNEDTGREYIQKYRNKTGVQFTVFQTSQCTNVLDKLMALSIGEDLVFNLPSIENISRLYKKLAKMAGITSNVSTYTLRHTFAVNFMESNGRIEDLKEFLGHDNLKTTQIYAKISKKRLIEKTDNLEALSLIHQLQPKKTNLLVAV